MNKFSILVVEDDPNLGFVVEDYLQREGYHTVWAPDGERGWEAFVKAPFDLCIVDVMMPKMDGFTLVRRIREKDEMIPVLFLTARSMEEDRLKGFEIGGDDYITKPFSVTELGYRIKVFLRRKGHSPPGEELRIGKLYFDPVNLSIRHDTGGFSLTQIEADLLKMLYERTNRLVKREEILIKIWGENDYFKGRSLDVFISRLRKYLKNDTALEIRNHHGVGFMLVVR